MVPLESEKALADQLAGVRECLEEVAKALAGLAPKGELEKAHEASVEDNKRWRRSVALLILGGPVLFLVNLGVYAQARHNEKVFKRDIRQGMTCLLGDVSSHRRDQRAIEESLIKQLKLDTVLGPPTPVPASDLDQMVATCAPVLQRFLGYSLGGQGIGPNQAGRR